MTTGDTGTEGYFPQGVNCCFLDAYVFHMSERFPDTFSAHTVLPSHGQMGIWKHGGMFLEAHVAVSCLTPVAVSGSLGPKLPFLAFEALLKCAESL